MWIIFGPREVDEYAEEYCSECGNELEPQYLVRHPLCVLNTEGLALNPNTHLKQLAQLFKVDRCYAVGTGTLTVKDLPKLKEEQVEHE